MKKAENKTLLFKMIAIGAVIVFFLLIELALRVFVPVNHQNERLVDLGELTFFSKVTIQGVPSIRITSKYGYSDQQTTFKAKKSPGTYRIFCLGGSAAAGWPHPANERFSTYLDTCLKNTYPDKRIEIINCSAHGFASYRVREVFHQLIPYQPDAVIVWSGNNEFLEDQRFKTSKVHAVVDALAKKIRIVQLIKKALPKQQLDGNQIEVASSFWKKTQQQSLELCSDPVLALKVNLVYEQSINEITTEAAQNKIKVLLFTVPVNLRDWQPNVSYCSLKGQDSVKWSKIYNLGRAALRDSDYLAANKYFKEAISKEPLHAMTYFNLAKSAEQLNDTTAALQNYVLAKDLDYNPFRAITNFNEIVRKIAASQTNASLFDAEKLFQKFGKQGIPGFDLFLDYVHPTREGNLILASELSEYIRKGNLFGIGASEIRVDNQELHKMVSGYSDENDIQLQVTRFSLCCLTHQYESAIRFGSEILGSLPADYQANPQNKNDILKLKEGVKVFSRFLDIDSRSLEGIVDNGEMQVAKKEIRLFYETYYPYGTF